MAVNEKNDGEIQIAYSFDQTEGSTSTWGTTDVGLVLMLDKGDKFIISQTWKLWDGGNYNGRGGLKIDTYVDEDTD